VANFGTNSTCSNFLGNVTSTQTKQLICSTRDRIGLDTSKMRVAVCLAPTTNTVTRVGYQNKCSGDSAATGTGVTDYTGGNSMAVCAMYPATSRSGFLNPFLGNGVVTTRVVIRIEQTSWDLAGVQAPRAVDDFSSGFEDITGGNGFPTGKNWNFCVP
jgi:hypothetical protein